MPNKETKQLLIIQNTLVVIIHPFNKWNKIWMESTRKYVASLTPWIHSSSQHSKTLNVSWHWSRCVSYKKICFCCHSEVRVTALAQHLPMPFLRNLESTASMAMYPRRNIFLCMSSLHTMAPTQSFSTIACDTSERKSHRDCNYSSVLSNRSTTMTNIFIVRLNLWVTPLCCIHKAINML